MTDMVEVFAHRGMSGAHPEMTQAAFAAAVEFARTRQVRLGVECDVHFTGDGVLGCLHDSTVARTGRTADGSGIETPMVELSVAELGQLDFGSWRDDLAGDLTDADRRFMSLPDLLELVAQAKQSGVEVGMAIETKHPVPRDTEVEAALADLLRERGWTDATCGVRMITFDPAAITRMADLLPDLPLTFLVYQPGVWEQVDLRRDIAIGVSLELIKDDPTVVARIHEAGRECHVWTVNESDDIQLCLDRGVEAITSDFPDRVWDLLDS